MAYQRLEELKMTFFEASNSIQKCYGNSSRRDSHWEAVLKTYKTLLNPSSTQDDVERAAGYKADILALVDTHHNNKIENGQRLREYLDNHITQQKGDGTGGNAPSRVEMLSQAFPKHRPKVNFLRGTDEDEINDPNIMAEITKKFWGKLFLKQRLKYKKIGRVIRRNYGSRQIEIPPLVIDKTMVAKTIIGMGKTAPGPDNIPFKAYKVVVEEASEVLYYVIKALMAGKTPPYKFNHSIFHLLPKKGTGYIEDTRPLSVSNTYNRIIAATIKTAIQPSILGYISKDQTGFWPGRSMDENIEYFNEMFYAALDKGEEYSVFLFDIQKAFDSVSHKTLHALLEHIGLPLHYCNAIKGLFHEVTVTTNFQGAQNLDIPVERGIKQGCPLSPLLFIAVMDILHHLLSKHAGVTVKMFADDTAAGAAKITKHLGGIKFAFQRFADITGLELNMSKTLLLTTLAPSKRGHIVQALKDIDWEDVKIAEKGIYLGVPLGRYPGTEINDAFRDKVIKFRQKIKAYLPHKSRLSTAMKITMINVFLLPLFSYPNKFFLQPSCTRKMINSDINGFLMQGHAIDTNVYSRPAKELGARGGNRLVDNTIMNLASLASKIDIDTVKTHQVTGMTRRKYRGKLTMRPILHTWSLRIKTQRTIAAHHIHKKWELKFEDFVGKPTSVIYSLIINSQLFTQEWRAYTSRSLLHFGVEEKNQHVIYSNHARLLTWVPDYAVFNQVLIWHNALQTTELLARVYTKSRNRGEKRKSPHVTQVHCCYLCGDSVDNTKHVYLDMV